MPKSKKPKKPKKEGGSTEDPIVIELRDQLAEAERELVKEEQLKARLNTEHKVVKEQLKALERDMARLGTNIPNYANFQNRLKTLEKHDSDYNYKIGVVVDTIDYFKENRRKAIALLTKLGKATTLQLTGNGRTPSKEGGMYRLGHQIGLYVTGQAPTMRPPSSASLQPPGLQDPTDVFQTDIASPAYQSEQIEYENARKMDAEVRKKAREDMLARINHRRSGSGRPITQLDTGPLTGSGMSAPLLKEFIDLSYRGNTSIAPAGWSIDAPLSDSRVKVYAKNGSNDKDIVVTHRGSVGLDDWMDNASYMFRGKVKGTKTYNLHRDRHKRAIDKYGASNITAIGHSRAGLYLQELQKEFPIKENITYNKASGFHDIGRQNDPNQTDVRVGNDVVSLLAPLQRRNNAIVNISGTKNPFDFNAAHQTAEIDKVGDQYIGKGRKRGRPRKIGEGQGSSRIAPAPPTPQVSRPPSAVSSTSSSPSSTRPPPTYESLLYPRTPPPASPPTPPPYRPRPLPLLPPNPITNYRPTRPFPIILPPIPARPIRLPPMSGQGRGRPRKVGGFKGHQYALIEDLLQPVPLRPWETPPPLPNSHVDYFISQMNPADVRRIEPELLRLNIGNNWRRVPNAHEIRFIIEESELRGYQPSSSSSGASSSSSGASSSSSGASSSSSGASGSRSGRGRPKKLVGEGEKNRIAPPPFFPTGSLHINPRIRPRPMPPPALAPPPLPPPAQGSGRKRGRPRKVGGMTNDNTRPLIPFPGHITVKSTRVFDDWLDDQIYELDRYINSGRFDSPQQADIKSLLEALLRHYENMETNIKNLANPTTANYSAVYNNVIRETHRLLAALYDRGIGSFFHYDTSPSWPYVPGASSSTDTYVYPHDTPGASSSTDPYVPGASGSRSGRGRGRPRKVGGFIANQAGPPPWPNVITNQEVENMLRQMNPDDVRRIPLDNIRYWIRQFRATPTGQNLFNLIYFASMTGYVPRSLERAFIDDGGASGSGIGSSKNKVAPHDIQVVFPQYPPDRPVQIHPEPAPVPPPPPIPRQPRRPRQTFHSPQRKKYSGRGRPRKSGGMMNNLEPEAEQDLITQTQQMYPTQVELIDPRDLLLFIRQLRRIPNAQEIEQLVEVSEYLQYLPPDEESDEPDEPDEPTGGLPKEGSGTLPVISSVEGIKRLIATEQARLRKIKKGYKYESPTMSQEKIEEKIARLKERLKSAKANKGHADVSYFIPKSIKWLKIMADETRIGSDAYNKELLEAVKKLLAELSGKKPTAANKKKTATLEEDQAELERLLEKDAEKPKSSARVGRIPRKKGYSKKTPDANKPAPVIIPPSSLTNERANIRAAVERGRTYNKIIDDKQQEDFKVILKAMIPDPEPAQRTKEEIRKERAREAARRQRERDKPSGFTQAQEYNKATKQRQAKAREYGIPTREYTASLKREAQLKKIEEGLEDEEKKKVIREERNKLKAKYTYLDEIMNSDNTDANIANTSSMGEQPVLVEAEVEPPTAPLAGSGMCGCGLSTDPKYVISGKNEEYKLLY
jgi:hypothetical protein